MSNDNSSDTSTSRFAHFFDKNGAWYVAAAFMIIVLVGIVVLLVAPADKDSDEPTGTDPLPTAPLSSLPPSTSPSAATGWADLGCNGTKGSTDVPNLPPKATWAPVGPASAPVSGTYGPKSVDGYIRQCYQHSPTGAVIAAANVTVAARVVPESERSKVLTAMMTAGPGRDESISGGTPETTSWRISAFSVESCAPERCNIRFVLSIGAALGYADMSMIWVDGDWRLDGAQGPEGGALDAIPAGYVSWGA